jgi:RimJ/RimL family protein N-acetyltransferase
VQQGFPFPQRQVIPGRTVRLEPLGLEHAKTLYEASHPHPERFEYLFETAPENQGEIEEWISAAQERQDPMFFAVVDNQTNRAEGRQALMRIDSANGVLELGSIYWGPSMTRRVQATEAFFLAARYVFDHLGYRRLEWKLNASNKPSHRSAKRFGFTYEGVFRQHMIVKGKNRDTAWYAMLDSEWPNLRAEFERWLDPSNFDDTGKQLTPLSMPNNQGD